MSRIWRALGVTVLAGSMAGAAGPPALAAPSSTVTITISASSAAGTVGGDVIVYYRSGARTATLSGTITGAASGNVATLYAQRFPFTSAPAPVAGQSVTLNPPDPTTPVPYSFTAIPSLATHYLVEVFASATATTPLATSPAATVYVGANSSVSGGQKCTRPVCKEKWREYTVLPASAFSRESTKHVYFYLGVRRSRTTTPPPPAWLHLDKTATVSNVRRISAHEYEQTLRFSFWIGNDGYYYRFATCTKNTEAQDGLGLPGHHSCGARRIRASVPYLGAPIRVQPAGLQAPAS